MRLALLVIVISGRTLSFTLLCETSNRRLGMIFHQNSLHSTVQLLNFLGIISLYVWEGLLFYPLLCNYFNAPHLRMQFILNCVVGNYFRCLFFMLTSFLFTLDLSKFWSTGSWCKANGPMQPGPWPTCGTQWSLGFCFLFYFWMSCN